MRIKNELGVRVRRATRYAMNKNYGQSWGRLKGRKRSGSIL